MRRSAASTRRSSTSTAPRWPPATPSPPPARASSPPPRRNCSSAAAAAAWCRSAPPVAWAWWRSWSAERYPPVPHALCRSGFSREPLAGLPRHDQASAHPHQRGALLLGAGMLDRCRLRLLRHPGLLRGPVERLQLPERIRRGRVHRKLRLPVRTPMFRIVELALHHEPHLPGPRPFGPPASPAVADAQLARHSGGGG